jgi:hypothetical protein
MNREAFQVHRKSGIESRLQGQEVGLQEAEPVSKDCPNKERGRKGI